MQHYWYLISQIKIPFRDWGKDWDKSKWAVMLPSFLLEIKLIWKKQGLFREKERSSLRRWIAWSILRSVLNKTQISMKFSECWGRKLLIRTQRIILWDRDNRDHTRHIIIFSKILESRRRRRKKSYLIWRLLLRLAHWSSFWWHRSWSKSDWF